MSSRNYVKQNQGQHYILATNETIFI